MGKPPNPLAQVRRAIKARGLIARDDRVAVALSGGSDSVALTLLLNDLAARGGFAIAGVIHVNHQLRGDESLRDASCCRALAARLGLPIDVVHVDVAAAMRESRQSVEAAARALRYRALTDAASRLGATRVATGHTLDDQAETVLMRLLRGAGHRGVGGIRARRGIFIRPLLECRRQDLRAFVSGRGEFFCEDSSNQNDAIARNRLRHMLMPVIERLAPRGAAALARFAALATADEQYLEQAANAASATVVQSADTGVKVDRAALRALPSALSRRVVRRALEQTAGVQFSARHIGAVVDLVGAGRSRGHLDVPGLSIDVDAATLHIAPTTRTGGAFIRSKRDDANTPPDRPLAVPGSVHLEDGRIVTAVPGSGTATPAVPSGRGLEATVRADVVALPMSVRQRRPGDRLRPFGAPGRRKLQDLLVDRKIPRIARDQVPIVVDAAGRIVWVAGVTIAHECRVTEPGAAVVILKVERKLDS